MTSSPARHAQRFKSVAAVGAISRVLAIVAQLAVLFVLGRIMEKAQFGDFMIAFAIMRILSIGIGAGLSGILIYHVSRAPRDDLEIGLHRTCVLAAIAISGAIGLAIAVTANEIAAAFAKPTLASWLVALIPLLVFSTLMSVAVGSFDGRGRISASILVTEIAPNALRLLALPLLTIIGSTHWGIALVMALSVALPWIYVARRLFSTVIPGFAPLTGWDLRYGSKLALHSLASTQLQGIDIIVAGWLFSAGDVADYAIASRVAAVFPFFQQMRARTFTPVAGWLLARNDLASLQSEVESAKTFAFASVATTVGVILLASPLLPSLFWLSPEALRLLVLLSFPPLFRCLFATGDRLLQIAGQAGWSLGIMLTAMGLIIGIPLLTHGAFGIFSLPIAMIVSGVILNPVIAFVVSRTTGVVLVRPTGMAWAVAAAAAVLGPLLLLPASWAAPITGLLFCAIAATQVERGRLLARHA